MAALDKYLRNEFDDWGQTIILCQLSVEQEVTINGESHYLASMLVGTKMDAIKVQLKDRQSIPPQNDIKFKAFYSIDGQMKETEPYEIPATKLSKLFGQELESIMEPENH